jgi:AraC-like DNA-binding protein
VSGGLTVRIARRGHVACLSNVACTLGRRDKPFPEAHADGKWTVALVRRGSFRYRDADANRAHTVRAGWLLVGRPGAAYECSHEHDGGDDCASLSLPEQVIDDVLSAVRGARPLTAPVFPPIARVAALLERARAREDASVDEVAYLVAEAVVAHAREAPLADVARHPSHTGRVHDAIERIERACERPLPLTELAATAGLSPFHFLRVFRRVTGTTPHQYVIGARLRLAARLLLETNRPITHIAYDAGFEDLSNFVRTFHRVIGCSPRKYRTR